MNLLNIEHISKIYGEKIIFDDASFGVQEGDKIGIVGINGTGKTTLLRMIAGTEVPDDGQIIRQNGMKIAHLTQNPVFPEGATILSYVQSVAEDMEWRVQSNLNTLGITDRLRLPEESIRISSDSSPDSLSKMRKICSPVPLTYSQ